MENKELVTRVFDTVKANAGKIAGAVALGTGIAVDVIRAKKHTAVIGDDDGRLTEANVDTIDDSGMPVPEEKKDE